MKKIIVLTLIFLSTFYFFSQKDSIKDDEWVTFKNEGNNIKSYQTTKAEKKKANIIIKKENNKRLPASIPERKTLLLADQKKPKNLEYKNSPRKDWQKKMALNLMRFQDIETKLLVNKVESMVILEKGKGLNVEKVHVKYITKNGRHYGFHALVNSETGDVIRTWNRIQHEGYGHEKLKLRASNIN